MSYINSFFAVLFAPLGAIPITLALILSAIAFGVLLVPVYGKVSPQRVIARSKKRIFAALYESVLFRRNTGLSLRAQLRMFLNGLVYFFVAIPPILILSIPCVLVLAQFNLVFGARGLVPGEPFVISAKLADSVELKNTSLELDRALEVAGPVRVKESSEVTWRVVLPPPQDGKSTEVIPLRLKSGNESLALDIQVGAGKGRIHPENSQSFWTQLLYPAAFPMPAWITDLEIAYPERVFNFGLFSAAWFIPFLIISIASGYVASKIFGVEV